MPILSREDAAKAVQVELTQVNEKYPDFLRYAGQIAVYLKSLRGTHTLPLEEAYLIVKKIDQARCDD